MGIIEESFSSFLSKRLIGDYFCELTFRLSQPKGSSGLPETAQ